MFIKVLFDEIQIDEFNVNLHSCWTFLYASIDKILIAIFRFRLIAFVSFSISFSWTNVV